MIKILTNYFLQDENFPVAIDPTRAQGGALLTSLDTGAPNLTMRHRAASTGTDTANPRGGRPGSRSHNFFRGSALPALVIDYLSQVTGRGGQQVKLQKSVEDSLVEGASNAVELRCKIQQLVVGDGSLL
jgi:hypothetical protein